MQRYDIVIIGGGAAGLMAASRCVGSGLSVLLLEKNRECGKKVLITGKGRCNITNSLPWKDFSHHIHPDHSFLKNAFFHFSNTSVVSFLEEIGVPCKEERGNRIFPVSDRSHDVRDALVRYITKGGVSVLNSAEVHNLTKEKDGYLVDFWLNGNENLSVFSSKIILATGGLSYPTTGSTGDGYRLAASMGHNLVETFPSLTALKPSSIDSRLEGLLLKNIKMDLWVNGSVVQSEFGETQFTSGGIEGALGFRVSRKAVKGLMNGQKVEIVIDLKPAVSEEELRSRVLKICRETNSKKMTQILPKLMPKEMIAPFIESTMVTIETLPVKLKEWRFRIVDYVGYERAVITAGGISLDEISRKTMESKISSGLYFSGEIINLDGDTGGYNLQVAFSSGALAADSAIKSLAIL